MTSLLLDPGVWISLFSVTLVQIALGADNLIIITIIANKLPEAKRPQAVRLGLILAMAFRIVLLAMVSFILKYATGTLFDVEWGAGSALHLHGEFNGKSLLLIVGGLFLIWKGIKELRVKAKDPFKCSGVAGRWTNFAGKTSGDKQSESRSTPPAFGRC